MDVRVLGEVAITSADGLRSVPGARQRTLLVLLALRAGHDLDRGGLAEHLFGPDTTRSPAALQVCVSRLRQAMGSLRGALVTTARGYRLDIDPAQVDALRLSAAVTASREGPVDIAALRRALAEWTGPAFGGADRPTLLELEEHRLLELRMEGTLTLAETLRDQGHTVQALEVVEDALMWATEGPALTWMRAQRLALMGRATATSRLAAALSSGGEGAEVGPGRPPPDPVEPATWPEALTRASSRSLVGSVHQGVVRSARRPRPPQLTVLVGESGRGKTATAAQWARAWTQRGRQVIYLPLDAASSSGRSLDDLRAELADSPPTDPPPVAAEPSRWAVVLDDAHALSTLQVEVAFEVVRALVDRGVPVLLTGHPAPPGSTWGQILQWTATAEGSERHELPALDRQEVRAILIDSGRQLDPQRFDDLVDKVWVATAGNAMAAAAVAGLVEAMPPEQRSAEQVPVVLTEVAGTQLRSLDPEAHAAILAVAVLDTERVGPGTVQAIIGLGADDTVAALKNLERKDLVLTESDGWVRAPHPLYRQALLAGLDPLDRRLLHLRASEALDELGDQLAATRQRCMAAPLVDAIGAVRQSLEALRQAPPDLPPAEGLAVAEAARAALAPVSAPPPDLPRRSGTGLRGPPGSCRPARRGRASPQRGLRRCRRNRPGRAHRRRRHRHRGAGPEARRHGRDRAPGASRGPPRGAGYDNGAAGRPGLARRRAVLGRLGDPSRADRPRGHCGFGRRDVRSRRGGPGANVRGVVPTDRIGPPTTEAGLAPSHRDHHTQRPATVPVAAAAVGGVSAAIRTPGRGPRRPRPPRHPRSPGADPSRSMVPARATERTRAGRRGERTISRG